MDTPAQHVSPLPRARDTHAEMPRATLDAAGISRADWQDVESWGEKEYSLFHRAEYEQLAARSTAARAILAGLLQCPATWEAICAAVQAQAETLACPHHPKRKDTP